MNPSLYRCPVCRGSLALNAQALVCAQGHRHPVVHGLPDFVPQETLNEEQRQSIDYYDQSAAIYDDVADLSFRIQKQDEAATRREFVKLLALKPDDRVLEIATGTGRDAVNIADQLGADGLQSSPPCLHGWPVAT